MRHDGRADDPDREVDRLGRAEPRRQEALEASLRGRPDLQRLVEEAEEDDPEQRRDRELEAAEAVPLQLEEPERDHAGDHAGDRSGTWKRRLSPSAAPRNSAMSVDIAIISAWIQSPQDTGRG